MAVIVSETVFKNSDTCEGVSFYDPHAPHDMSDIDIDGRYPEQGWAMNEVSHEMVYVAEGLGKLALKNGETISLPTGASVSISPGEWFAWEGTMRLIMSCSPPFHKDQYRFDEGGSQ